MLRLLLLIICLHQHCLGSRTPPRALSPPEKIGEGVILTAIIYYDHSYDTPLPIREVQSDSSEEWLFYPDPIEIEFAELFSKVKEHFHKESVMIDIYVAEFSKAPEIAVLFQGMDKSLNGPQTLKSLEDRVKKEKATNDTIFYFFTKKEILEENERGDQIHRSVREQSTWKTFCTEKKSAAVVRYSKGREDHMSTVEATANIFGSRRGHRISPSQRQTMKDTFRNCYKDMPASEEELEKP